MNEAEELKGSPTEAQRRAREWIQRNARACPCCGGSVVIAVAGGALVEAAWRELVRGAAGISLVRAEQAEREIAARDFRPVDPIGGPV